MEDQTLALAKSYESKLVLDSKQNTDEVSSEVDARNARSICLYVLTNEPSVSAGTVVLEGAPVENYGGTWKTLATVANISGGSKAFAATAYEDDDGMPCRVVRARISSQIGNGSIDAYLQIHR